MSDTELLHKSKPEPVRRLEVFTGTGRRRTWTAEQKAQIVAESYVDGERVTAVAHRHGLTPQQLFGWRRQALRHALRKAEKSGLTARSGGAELVDRFYAVFAQNMHDLGTPVYPVAFFRRDGR